MQRIKKIIIKNLISVDASHFQPVNKIVTTKDYGSIMKIGNHPLTGTLFFPTLGVALCGLVISYWMSKRKQKSHPNAVKIADIETREMFTKELPVENGKIKTVKEKKAHKCGCGSESKSDVKPTTVNIMYGTMTGKSKVCVFSF